MRHYASFVLAAILIAVAQDGRAAVSVAVVGQADGFPTQAGSLSIDVNPDDTFSASGLTLGNANSPLWQLESFDINGAINPFVSQGFSVVNTSAVPVTFTITTTVPIAPPLTGGTVVGGSTGITVTDANNDGVGSVTTLAGVPVFGGTVDGSIVLPLLADPFTLTVPFAGGTASATDDAGLPGPSIISGPALTSIGIVQEFVLSPGDRAVGSAFFDIEPIVPEPTSVLIFAGLALLGVRGSGRLR